MDTDYILYRIKKGFKFRVSYWAIKPELSFSIALRNKSLVRHVVQNCNETFRWIHYRPGFLKCKSLSDREKVELGGHQAEPLMGLEALFKTTVISDQKISNTEQNTDFKIQFLLKNCGEENTAIGWKFCRRGKTPEGENTAVFKVWLIMSWLYILKNSLN